MYMSGGNSAMGTQIEMLESPDFMVAKIVRLLLPRLRERLGSRRVFIKGS